MLEDIPYQIITVNPNTAPDTTHRQVDLELRIMLEIRGFFPWFVREFCESLGEYETSADFQQIFYE
jgi:hypothetical protein